MCGRKVFVTPGQHCQCEFFSVPQSSRQQQQQAAATAGSSNSRQQQQQQMATASAINLHNCSIVSLSNALVLFTRPLRGSCSMTTTPTTLTDLQHGAAPSGASCSLLQDITFTHLIKRAFGLHGRRSRS
jgi:hypothetical protein